MSRQRFFYTLIIFLLLPWAAVYLLWRARRQRAYLRHWDERWGFFPERTDAANQAPMLPIIWLHAVSVGETRAVQPLLTALQARYPRHRFLLTHMTPTGRETSAALFGDQVEHCYLPYDTPGAMRRFLRRYRPGIGVMMETEIWPNLLAECRAAGVPVCLLNARLSVRSARRYARWPQLAREAMQAFRLIGAQSAEDAARLSALGAPLETAKVHVTGNMKFDIEPPPAQLALAQRLRARIGQRAVWLAASTREGEEALILAAWARALKNYRILPDRQKVGAGETAIGRGQTGDSNDGSTHERTPPLLIIVPRHPQRFDEVARLVVAQGLTLQRRSEDQAATGSALTTPATPATPTTPMAPSVSPATQVWLGDSMGELFAWYATADVAFIGGSLKDYGSQNLIEACAVGTPVLLGPSTFNFAQAAKEAVACGAAIPIQDADDLVRQVLCLLDGQSVQGVAARQNMREAGLDFAQRHRGATAVSVGLIAALIES